MDSVLVKRDGDIATVTLNAPARLNALDRDMWARLGEAMRALGADDTLRCIVLRGAGEKAFAAGADVSEFAAARADSRHARRYGELVHATLLAVGRCRHPTVAMVRGACVGAGLEIAAMCDLRICGESSRFGIPVSRLGLAVGYGELQGLLALAGRAVTLELLLEGRLFDAGEALAKRIVNRVVPDDQVEEEAGALARRIAESAPLVARWHKQFVERLAVTPDLDEAEWAEGYACFDTEDYREGVRAFLAKEKPTFRGK